MNDILAGLKFANFPDHLLGFSIDKLITNDVGTIFRLPLRCVESEISKHVIDTNELDKIIDLFKCEMQEALIFLRNIKCIKVSDVTSGHLIEEYTVNLQLTDYASETKSRFNSMVKALSTRNKDAKERNLDVGIHNAIYPLTVIDSNALVSEWLLVQKFGFEGVPNKIEDLKKRIKDGDLGLLPVGGVAIPMSAGSNELTEEDYTERSLSQTSKQSTSSVVRSHNVSMSSSVFKDSLRGKVFCFLPLPEYTGLPVHINGHFALNHDSRRDLWKEGYRMEWNSFLLDSIIVPAFVTGLVNIKDYVDAEVIQANAWYKVNATLKSYHTLFPLHSPATSDIWERVVTKFYKTLIDDGIALFPCVNDTQNVKLRNEKPTYRCERFYLKWVYVRNASDSNKSGVFNSLSEHSVYPFSVLERDNTSRLENLLKSFGMNILASPVTILKELGKAGIKNVPVSSPSFVLSFLSSSSCECGPVDVEVTESKFVSAENLYSLVRFVVRDSDYASKLNECPILLTGDGILRYFSTESPVFISEYSKLLPESQEQFVDDRLRSTLTEIGLLESKVCKIFHLDDFVRMLPLSMAESVFAVGKSIQLDTKGDQNSNSISQAWLCLLYDFLSDQSAEEKVTNQNLTNLTPFTYTSSTRKIDLGKFRMNIQKLKMWSFLPSVECCADHSLIPVKEISHLLFLSVEQAKDRLGAALEHFRLPALDTAAFSKCIKKDNVISTMIKCVASLDSPALVLECLINHREYIRKIDNITVVEATEIMTYFERNSSVLFETSEDVLSLKVRRLPFFITIQGTLTSIDGHEKVLLIPKGVPCSGIQDLCDNMIFLEEKGTLLYLYEKLTLQLKDIDSVYAEFILPRLNRMDKRHWLEHIVFLRDRLGQQINTPARERIVQQLQEIPFIRVNGEMKYVRQLYDTKNELFRLMKASSDFPPEYFLHPDWRFLLKILGLICDVNDSLLVELALEIQDEARKNGSDSLNKKSELLLDRMLKKGSEWQRETLIRLKNIRFISPCTVGPKKTEIFPQYYESSNNFVCFQNSISKSYSSLCWTTINLIKDRLCKDLAKNVRKHLQVYEEPPVDKVILHCQNVCDSLKLRIKSTIMDNDFVSTQMTKLYQFFDKHISRYPEIKSRLQLKPFVHLPEQSDMVLNSQIIIDLHSEIKPFLYKAPKYYGKYHRLFEKMGSKSEIMFCHYVEILNMIKQKCQNGEISPAERGIVTRVVNGLFYHDVEKDKSIGEVQSLYLPNEDLVLVKSNTLIVSNSLRFAHRLDTNVKINYIAGIYFSGFANRHLEDIFAKWPTKLKPLMLTDLVEETVSLEDQNEGSINQNIKGKAIETFLHSTYIADALGDILRHQDAKEQSDFKLDKEKCLSKLRENLLNISAIGMSDIQSYLKFKGQIIEKSKRRIEYHIKDADGKTIFYFRDVNGKDVLEDMFISKGILALIRKCVPAFDADSVLHITSLLHVIHTPEKVPEVMKRLEIEPLSYDFSLRKYYFPDPGTYVEPKFIPFLEQGIYRFRDYEYDCVAMELLQDFTSETNFEPENVPLYVYVRILSECCQEDLSSDLKRRYIVQTGSFTEEVPIFRLFRFVRKEKEPGTELQSYDTEPINSRILDEHCRRIRNDIREAWTLPADDRRRVIRRLLFKWHPDKNRGNEEYCKSIFQYMRIVISRLENEETVSEDINDEMNRGPSECSSSTSSYFHSVSRSAEIYARAFHENICDYNKSERTGHFAHISAQEMAISDPSEARRWMRQAKNDFKAAIALLPMANDCKCYNWMYYLCHQACEKALKAVKYSTDANNVPRGHRSHTLTSLTCDSTLLEQARQLEVRLGEHARLRYPDAVPRPKIPSDIFSKEDADFSIGVARRIIDMAEEIVS